MFSPSKGHFGSEKNESKNHFWSEKILIRKKIKVQIKFGLEKILVGKNFGSEKNFGPEKKFGVEKNFVSKNVRSKKVLSKNSGPKKNQVQLIFGPKKFGLKKVQNIFRSKKYLCQKKV